MFTNILMVIYLDTLETLQFNTITQGTRTRGNRKWLLYIAIIFTTRYGLNSLTQIAIIYGIHCS